MESTYIAWVAHEANRALQTAQCDPSIPVAEDWLKISDDMRASVIDGVEKILSGEITTPEESHNNWLAFKEAQGWKFGSVKDEERKEHPCFVAYEDLPAAQRIKDRLYFSIVKALADGPEPGAPSA